MSAERTEDDIWRRAEIDSPCVKICVIHPESGFCIGCYRTGDEIAAWSGMTPAARRVVMEELPAREAKLSRRPRRGRAARRGGAD
ncbi:DUF1289 domain-containing protein [Pikeienuella sp. HZG-20]|uniref:DUF1289 domain-containing protein n=1 Tax=Paludibacillus litoralis TaxID=3133267 RepID=UPI0030EDF236